jgi:hypothetical protein
VSEPTPTLRLSLPPHEVLKKGDSGALVQQAQLRLLIHGINLEPYGADAEFGELTKRGVKLFQRKENIPITGEVDIRTWEELMDKEEPSEQSTVASYEHVAKPDFSPLASNAARAAVFGKFKYRPAPTQANPERIVMLDDWLRKNTTVVEIPQLTRIPGIMWRGKRWSKGPKGGMVRCHKLIADQLVGLWDAWDRAGFIDLIKTWDGLGNPRFIRGSQSILSNHAWYTAFDINYRWNMLGKTPAEVNEEGSVRKLVPLAHEFGFYWGGHFRRRDGMHFEASKVLEDESKI